MKFKFIYDGGGTGKGGIGKLYINNKLVADGRIDKTVAGRFGLDTFGIGKDTGSPVGNTYKTPFKFTRTIHKVDIYL